MQRFSASNNDAGKTLNNLLFNTGLLGASGVVFMLILLSSFTNVKSGNIPLTFILIIFLFMGKEVYTAFSQDNISQFAHILGGICGGVFGFKLIKGVKPADAYFPKSQNKNTAEENI